ncbi:MAG TPA: hypothetical protein VK395_15085 [Gemmataceae bacterium]|nr:hypothetical protein [Gemmataceae bacterium]
MTQTIERLSLYAMAMTLLAGMAWAGEKKPNSPELLPYPKPCSGQQDVVTPELLPNPRPCCEKTASHSGCCAEVSECPACAQGSCQPAHGKAVITSVIPIGQFFPSGTTPAHQEENLIKLITKYVRPSTWSSVGGTGTIEYYPLGRALVVNQSAATVAEINDLLASLEQIQKAVAATPNAEGSISATNFMIVATKRAPQPGMVPAVSAFASAPSCQPTPPPAPCSTSCPVTGICTVQAGDNLLQIPCGSSAPCCVAPASNLGVVGYQAVPVVPPATAAVPCPFVCAPTSIMVQTSVPAHAAFQGCWKLVAIGEEGKTKLSMSCNCSMSMVCDSLEMKMPGNARIKFAAAEKHVSVIGPNLTAMADAVSSGKAGCLVFEGHVHLQFERQGQSATVTAEHVMVNMADGRVEIDPRACANPAPRYISLSQLLDSISHSK